MSALTPACFPARQATIRLRTKRDKIGPFEPTHYTVIFPADWTRQQLLDYVREVHPNETAKIVIWGMVPASDPAKLWLANPRAFVNFKKGELRKKDHT